MAGGLGGKEYLPGVYRNEVKAWKCAALTRVLLDGSLPARSVLRALLARLTIRLHRRSTRCGMAVNVVKNDRQCSYSTVAFGTHKEPSTLSSSTVLSDETDRARFAPGPSSGRVPVS